MNYYEGKRVLVTGGEGFIGSHLVDRLKKLKAKLFLFQGDIADNQAITAIIDVKPDIIFHLAALAYVNLSFEFPFRVIQVNYQGTLNVLQAVMSLKDLEIVVITSSSEIYGMNYQESKINEEHPLYPTSPYAASKVAADRTAWAFHKTYNLPITIIRPFNTYGPRHTYDVVPKFINLALHNEPITIYGTGEQSRDFTYVDDMVGAFLMMAEWKTVTRGNAVNFGTGVDTTINDLAEKIIRISGSKSKIVHIEARKAEVNKLLCDYGWAKDRLGWSPKVSLDEGLERNIEWVKKYLS